jgi:hypothetical protein
MVMVADLLPGLKRFLSGMGLKDAGLQMVMRMMVTFLVHSRRMSCLEAAGAVRSDVRHRAQVGRMLKRPRFGRLNLTNIARAELLAREAGRGRFLFIIDATLVGQVGQKTENTCSTGNRKRRPKKGRRYGKQKHAQKSCHSFTMGLLITPAGIRIPYSRPYRPREYCRKKGLVHRTTAEAAADLIRELPLPNEAEVILLGDNPHACSRRSECQHGLVSESAAQRESQSQTPP